VAAVSAMRQRLEMNSASARCSRSWITSTSCGSRLAALTAAISGAVSSASTEIDGSAVFKKCRSEGSTRMPKIEASPKTASADRVREYRRDRCRVEAFILFLLCSLVWRSAGGILRVPGGRKSTASIAPTDVHAASQQITFQFGSMVYSKKPRCSRRFAMHFLRLRGTGNRPVEWPGRRSSPDGGFEGKPRGPA
jgi:hypothetical protein